MMNNVVVYAIGQKYDINELKELAKGKFYDLLWLGAPNYAFPNIIDAVFETSTITDPGLRLDAIQYCTEFSTEILADDHLCGVIKDHGELGLGVLREVSEDLAQNLHQKRCLREQLVTLTEEIGHLVKNISRPQKSKLPRLELSSIAAVLQELKMTYGNLKVDSGESEEGG